MDTQCPKCNAKIPDESKFCKECGIPLTSSETSDETFTRTVETPIEDISRGTVFAKRYEIIEKLGKGGMGEVYKAYDNQLKEEVALKLIKSEIASDKKILDRFNNELKIARRVVHKNVGRMYELMEDEGTFFITMEYIPGQDLKGLIRQSQKLNSETAISIGIHICEGLKEAHRLGVVHRDLKPRNIMIDKQGNARIMDFGLARSLKEEGITRRGTIIGTPHYISPEQLEGDDIDQRSDIYSMGIILYEMLTGTVPFRGDTALSIAHKHKYEAPQDPKEINTLIPDDINQVILKCLEKDREKRYQNVEEVIKDLYSCQKNIKTPTQKNWKNLYKRPAFYIILISILALPLYYILIQNGGDIFIAPGLKRMNIVVLPFENYSGDPEIDHYRDSVPNSIILAVGQSKYIYPLPAVRLRSILKKTNHPEQEPFTKTVLDKIAKEEKTQFFVEGEYSRPSETIRFIVRITKPPGYETITHKIIEVTEKIDESDRIDELTNWIRTELGFTRYEVYDPEDISIKNLSGSYHALELYLQAQRAFFEAKYEESNQHLTEAIKLDPTFAMAYRKMATNYSYMGNAAQKREKLQIARNLADKGYGTTREQNLIKGYAAFTLDNSPEQAISYYNEVLKSYPEDVETHAMLGSVYRNLEEWRLAENHFLQALEFTPDLIHENLAWIYMYQGRYPEAINIINDNKEIITPLYKHKILAMVYLCQGNLKETVNQAEILKSAFQSYQVTTQIIGNIYQIQGNCEEARKYYTLLTQNPKWNFQGYEWLPLLMIQEGCFKKCEQELKRQIDMFKRQKNEEGEITFSQLIAYAYLQSHKPYQALQICEKILVNANLTLEESVFYHLIMGLSFLKLNDSDAAKKAVNEIEEIFETDEDTSYLKGYQQYLEGMISLEKGDFRTAIDQLEEANSYLPYQNSNFDQHAFYHDGLARAYYRAGDFVKAKTYYEKIQQLTTGRLRWGDLYVKSFYWLGKIAHRQGHIQEAKKNFSEFLRLWEKTDSELKEIKDAKELLKNKT